MSVYDNITITHFSFGTISMLFLFILFFLLRYFRKEKDKKEDIEIQLPPEIINEIQQNTVNAINNLPT